MELIPDYESEQDTDDNEWDRKDMTLGCKLVSQENGL